LLLAKDFEGDDAMLAGCRKAVKVLLGMAEHL